MSTTEEKSRYVYFVSYKVWFDYRTKAGFVSKYQGTSMGRVESDAPVRSWESVMQMARWIESQTGAASMPPDGVELVGGTVKVVILNFTELDG